MYENLVLFKRVEKRQIATVKIPNAEGLSISAW